MPTNIISDANSLVKFIRIKVGPLLLVFNNNLLLFTTICLSFFQGITVLLGAVVGVPFLYISDAIVRKVGSVNVFVLAFALYSVRFYGYSLIR